MSESKGKGINWFQDGLSLILLMGTLIGIYTSNSIQGELTALRIENLENEMSSRTILQDALQSDLDTLEEEFKIQAVHLKNWVDTTQELNKTMKEFNHKLTEVVLTIERND